MENKKMLNTIYQFPLADGTEVRLTLNFYYLYQLKNKHRALYDRYNSIMQSTKKNDFDILDMVTICYIAYVCANQNEEDLISEEDFYLRAGNDIEAIGKAVQALIRPKKA